MGESSIGAIGVTTFFLFLFLTYPPAAPTLPRIRYTSCFDVTHAPVATPVHRGNRGFVYE